MRWLYRWLVCGRMLFRRGRESKRLEAELQYHLDRQIAENMAAGMSSDEARYAALRTFGNPALVRDHAHSTWSWNWLELLLDDVRYGVRILARTPGFAAIAILVMAAGIGVSTAIFSAVRTVLLDPLPFKDPERLVQIVSRWPKTGDQNGWSAPFRDAADWKTTIPALRDVAMYRYNLVNLTGSGQTESLYGLRVTANLLPMLGVRPQLGGWFSAEYDRPGSNHVLILSDDLWHRRFHADPNIVGKVIHLDSDGYQVLGVMPKGFNFPLRLGTTAQLPTDQMQYWMPLGADLAKEQHGNPNAGIVARLAPGVRLGEAQAQLEAACRLLERSYPETNRDLTAHVSSLRQQTVHQINGPLLALLAATGLILLLTCANIASLLLARGESRANELAVRMALGGSAGRVARIPMIEGIVLCFCGCLLGVPLAIASLKFLIHLAPIAVPRLAAARIDWQAMAFAAVLALVTGVLVGGLNALQILKRSPRDVLSDTPRNSAGRPHARLRSTLVVGQVALAVILVSSAGLMLRTFVNLLSTDLGYQPDHVLYAVTVLPPSRYSQSTDRALFFRKVLDRLRSAPGIEFASVSTGFPIVGQYDSVKVETTGLARGDRSSGISADSNEISSGYLEAMGVRLIRGRFVSETDTANTPNIAVIDESLARALWPGQNPLGKLINTGDPAKPKWRQIVGVVAAMRNRSLDLEARPSVFVPFSQETGWVQFIVVKSHAAPKETTRLLKDTVASVDSNQGVFFAQSMPELIQDSIAIRHFLFVTLMFFGVVALILSVLGIYGLVSFFAASRTREVGIRIALGATRGSIAGLVVFQGIRLVVIGATVGVLGSILVSRLLKDLLFGVRPFDAGTLLITILVLGTATVLAALIPAWRSARLQPMQALRTE